MKRLYAMALAAAALLITGCAYSPHTGWITMIDQGRGQYNFNAIGDANWHAHCNLHANTHGNAHPDANCDARANVPRQIAAGDEIGAPRDASGWGPWPMDL